MKTEKLGGLPNKLGDYSVLPITGASQGFGESVRRRVAVKKEAESKSSPGGGNHYCLYRMRRTKVGRPNSMQCSDLTRQLVL